MRHRLPASLTDRADIYRRQETGENEIGEPIIEWTAVTEDAPCLFDDGSTSFVRESSGERVATPATVTFDHATDVTEGDRIDVGGGWFEVVGIDETRDHRRGTIVSVEVELQESDPLGESDIMEA